jgi:hypothetical protein
MEKKALIVHLIQSNKRYWGKPLFEAFEPLFHDFHSSEMIAEIINKELGTSLKAYQIQNVRTKYFKPKEKVEPKPIEKSNQDSEEWAQNIYDKIYNQPKKTVFDLSGL